MLGVVTYMQNTLDKIPEGQSAIISHIKEVGDIRRRLLDIGLISGTRVECVKKSPLGDPIAFLIRGAVIALRKKDASKIVVVSHEKESNRMVALAGNPNVGKSTIFNALTGLKQHTGNWAGKTVSKATGCMTYKNEQYTVVDLPGCYSLMAHSAEEEIARDFICFNNPCVVVVCDATCLERNLNLALQTLEITSNVILCVNLMDEARKKKIEIDIETLSDILGIAVIETSARNKKGVDLLTQKMAEKSHESSMQTESIIAYPSYIEDILREIIPKVKKVGGDKINSRWLALKILENDQSLMKTASEFLQVDINNNEDIKSCLKNSREQLAVMGISERQMKDDIVGGIVKTAEMISADTVTFKDKSYNNRDRKIDKILTNKWTGIPIMMLMLLVTFWLTISGANYPSQLISSGLFWLEGVLHDLFVWVGVPKFLTDMLLFGVYRVVAWVVAVMLPPMAIFFPLFTLLEELGYLPRVAFNLDRIYKKCSACGKQALTMCMGFGCNAAGVVGCRIIDSPRERLIAIITNNFVPCNGRFPLLIAIISMFFVGTSVSFGQELWSAVLLTMLIGFGVMMTFVVSKILSKTILKGIPSSFTLELPPYRRPQIGKVIVRSLLDRTLFVLGRAVAVAAPTGLIIWLMANVMVGDISVLTHCSEFLDPFGRLIGMDGVILLAFILGIPANEIVVPIIIMTYMAQGNLVQIENLSVIKQLFLDNGWTWITAVSVMLFSLMHWPCSTTCLTIKKETQSLKWTIVSFAIPTIIGIGICFLFSSVARIFV